MTDDVNAGDNRPPVYFEDIDGRQVLIIRASAIGSSCLWELVAAGQGYEAGPLPDNLVRAFAEGNDLEPVVISMMEQGGTTYESHQAEGMLWLSDEVAIRYHPDGITRTSVDEVKALSDPLWEQAVKTSVGEVIDEYAWQLSVMMHDTGLPGRWIAYNKGGTLDPETGEREATPSKGKLHIEQVENPPVSLDEIKLKASIIKVLVEGEDILMTDRQCDDPSQWPCRYLHIRPEPEEQNVDHYYPEGEEADEIDKTIKSYLKFKGMEGEAKEQKNRYRDTLVNAHPSAKAIVTDQYQVPIVRGKKSRIAVENMTAEEREVFEGLKRKYTVQEPKAPYVTKVKRL